MVIFEIEGSIRVVIKKEYDGDVLVFKLGGGFRGVRVIMFYN